MKNTKERRLQSEAVTLSENYVNSVDFRTQTTEQHLSVCAVISLANIGAKSQNETAVNRIISEDILSIRPSGCQARDPCLKRHFIICICICEIAGYFSPDIRTFFSCVQRQAPALTKWFLCFHPSRPQSQRCRHMKLQTEPTEIEGFNNIFRVCRKLLTFILAIPSAPLRRKKRLFNKALVV